MQSTNNNVIDNQRCVQQARPGTASVCVPPPISMTNTARRCRQRQEGLQMNRARSLMQNGLDNNVRSPPVRFQPPSERTTRLPMTQRKHGNVGKDRSCMHWGRSNCTKFIVTSVSPQIYDNSWMSCCNGGLSRSKLAVVGDSSMRPLTVSNLGHSGFSSAGARGAIVVEVPELVMFQDGVLVCSECVQDIFTAHPTHTTPKTDVLRAHGTETHMFSFRKRTSNEKTGNLKTISYGARKRISSLSKTYKQQRSHQNHFAMMAAKRRSKNGKGEEPTYFVVDSGCSDHMSNASMECFATYSRVDTPITTAEAGGRLRCAGVGSMMLNMTTTTGSVVTIMLDKVLHVPSLTENLLSVSSLSALDGNGLVTNRHGATIFAGDLHFDAPRNQQGLYELPVRIVRRSQARGTALRAVMNKDQQLTKALDVHRALGHLSLKEIKRLITLSTMISVSERDKQAIMQLQVLPCGDCIAGKAVTTSVPSQGTKERSKLPGDLVHCDSCGPFKEQRLGVRYLQAFIDDCSRHVTLFKNTTLTMSETLDNMRAYDTVMYNTTGRHIRVFRADNGSEFDNTAMKRFCQEKGIRMQFCIPYKHGQNGVAERCFRTVTEAGVTQLLQSKLPYRFLFDACAHFNFSRNRMPSSGNGVSPHELLFGERPPAIRFLPFGCCVRPTIPPSLREKHTSRTESAILVGYAPQSKGGYWIYRPATQKVVMRDDLNPSINEFPGIDNETDAREDLDAFSFDDVYHHDGDDSQEESQNDKHDHHEAVAEEEKENQDDDDMLADDIQDDDDMEDVTEEEGKAWHSSHVPSKFAMIAKIGEAADARFWATALMADVVPEDNPTWAQASRSPDRDKWLEAVAQEVQAHIDNHSFEIVVPPKGAKTIDSRWVFKIKRDADGKIQKYKARMVAKGFQTKEGVHYHETFAPTISSVGAKLVFAVATRLGFHMIQMDVKTAFLIPRLPKNLGKHFMRIPGGFREAFKKLYPDVSVPEGAALDLQSVIYGLKPAAHFWNNDITDTLVKEGLIQSEMEPCLFVKVGADGHPICLVALYVDDLIIAGHVKEVDKVRKSLSKAYPMKDLGFPSTWTGIQVHQGQAGTLHLHQGGYIEQVLTKFGFQDSKPEASPTTSVGLDTITPSTEKEKKEMQEVPFRNALGCLLWLATNARPDIAYAVHQVARRAADPTMEAWTAIKRIFRYLKGTPTLGVTFRRSGSKSTSNDDVLTCYSDTDWAGESSRYTTASSQVYIWGALIANKVKLLKNIALSSMEAELMGYSETGKLGLYIINLLREMHMDHLIHQPVPVYGDNDAARLAVLRQGRTSRTRHIEVRHFWVREKVNEGIFRMERVATEDNPADIGTKPLSAKRFTQLVKKVIKELPAGAKKFKGKKS